MKAINGKIGSTKFFRFDFPRDEKFRQTDSATKRLRPETDVSPDESENGDENAFLLQSAPLIAHVEPQVREQQTAAAAIPVN